MCKDGTIVVKAHDHSESVAAWDRLCKSMDARGIKISMDEINEEIRKYRDKKRARNSAG